MILTVTIIDLLAYNWARAFLIVSFSFSQYR